MRGKLKNGKAADNLRQKCIMRRRTSVAISNGRTGFHFSHIVMSFLKETRLIVHKLSDQ